MSRRTAIAAPPAEPFDELFATIDQMTARDLATFVQRFRERYGLPHTSATTVRVDVSATYDADAWARWLNANGWVVS